MAGEDQATGAVDFLNDPDFQGLPMQEKHQVMLSLDPDYKSLPGSEQTKALSEIHYGKGGPGTGQKFLEERKPEKEEGSFLHGLRVLGRQVQGFAEDNPFVEGYKGYQEAQAGGAGTGLSAAYGAAKGINKLVGDPLGKAASVSSIPKEYHERRQSGYNPAYAAAAPVLAPQVGVNLPAMEHEADVGHTRGVAMEAAVPAAEAIGGEALSQAFKPGGFGTKYLENRRLRVGPENIEAGLDMPGGKRGQKAEDMRQNIQVATADLAEIGRETPGKVTRMLTRTSNAEALHDLAEKIDARQEDMWEKGHEPGIQRHAQAPIDQNRIVAAGRNELTAAATQANATEAAAASKWLDDQNVPMTLEHADNLIREINEDLKGKGAETRYGPLQVRTRQAVVKALRAEVDRVLGDAGEAGVKAVNRRWGALDAIKGRLRENAVAAARKENKEGFLPQWAHTYAFLHPDMGLSIGVGVNTAKALAPSLPGQTLRGVKQLGKTSLQGPYEAVTPPGWGTPPAGLLPAPSPQLPLPGAAAVNHPTGPASPAGPVPPQPGPGVPAPRQVYRTPETGRMQRGYLGVNPPIEMGRTAEGGPIYEPATPAPQRAERPVDQRKAMTPYSGTERRSATTISGADPMRMARIQVLRDIIADPTATSRDKVIAQQQLDDMLANPFERTNPAEVDVNKAKQKTEKRMTREEAEKASEERKLENRVGQTKLRNDLKGSKKKEVSSEERRGKEMSIAEQLERQKTSSQKVREEAKNWETGKPVTIEAYHSTDTGLLKTGKGGTFFHPHNAPTEYGSQLVRRELNFKNPLVIGDNIEAMEKLLSPKQLESAEATMFMESGFESKHVAKVEKMIADAARKKGYDGIIYTDPGSLTEHEYVALKRSTIGPERRAKPKGKK